MNQIILPTPPSANLLYRWGSGKMYPSKKYREWIKLAKSEVKAQGPYELLAEKTLYFVHIAAAINFRRDLDNVPKGILDILQWTDVAPDDRWIVQLLAERVPFGKYRLKEGQTRVQWGEWTTLDGHNWQKKNRRR